MVFQYGLTALLAGCAFLAGSAITYVMFRKERKPIFESGLDRDGTFLLFLLFALLVFVLVYFNAKITDHMIANLIGNVTGAILTACAFIFKDRKGA